MDVQTAKEFLERRSVDDLQSIIVLAQQRIQQIRENQQAKTWEQFAKHLKITSRMLDRLK